MKLEGIKDQKLTAEFFRKILILEKKLQNSSKIGFFSFRYKFNPYVFFYPRNDA